MTGDPAGDPSGGAGSAAPPGPFAALDARVGEVAMAAGAAVRTVIAPEQQDADNRTWIARQIITVFVLAISAVLFLLLLAGVFTREWSLMADRAADLIKTAVLPIVTLVLGYYFGKSGKG